MNNKKIDVLAVMDDVNNNILRPNGGCYSETLNEARSTVAELIEAANEYVISYLQDASSPSSSTDEATRLIVALTKIKGAA